MSDLSPRQWGKGDPEPADVKVVRHHAAPELDDFGRDCVWIRRTSDWKGPWGYALSWENLLIEHGPLTEVLPEPAVDWEPEPGAEVATPSGEVVTVIPRESFMRFNDFFALTVDANGQKYYYAVSDLKPIPPASSPQGAPISFSVGGGDGETVSDDFMADLVDIIHDNPTRFIRGDAEVTAAHVVEHFTAAGWRAPSTQDETEYGVRMTNGDVAGVGARHNAIGFLAGYGPEGELVQRSKPGPWVSVSSVEGDNG